MTKVQEIQYLNRYEINTGNEAGSEAGEAVDNINITHAKIKEIMGMVGIKGK
jgi:hypothetical protein